MRASHIFNPNEVSGSINDKQTNTLNLNFVPHTQSLLQELIPMNVKMPKSGRTKLEHCSCVALNIVPFAGMFERLRIGAINCNIVKISNRTFEKHLKSNYSISASIS